MGSARRVTMLLGLLVVVGVPGLHVPTFVGQRHSRRREGQRRPKARKSTPSAEGLSRRQCGAVALPRCSRAEVTTECWRSAAVVRASGSMGGCRLRRGRVLRDIVPQSVPTRHYGLRPRRRLVRPSGALDVVDVQLHHRRLVQLALQHRSAVEVHVDGATTRPPVGASPHPGAVSPPSVHPRSRQNGRAVLRRTRAQRRLAARAPGT
jgi:hypothetical protein